MHHRPEYLSEDDTPTEVLPTYTRMKWRCLIVGSWYALIGNAVIFAVGRSALYDAGLIDRVLQALIVTLFACAFVFLAIGITLNFRDEPEPENASLRKRPRKM